MSISPQFPVLPRPLIWKSPSSNSSGCMPLGNGSIGLNACESPKQAGLCSANEIETLTPDILLPEDGCSKRWCHRDDRSCWTSTLDHQDMTAWENTGMDPLKNRATGALLQGDGLVNEGACKLRFITHTPLPELLRFNDGNLLCSTDDWSRRRKEIADAILDLEYGGLPPAPESFRMEYLHTTMDNILPGVQFSSYRIHTGPGQGFPFTLTLLIPPGDGPFPVILNGDGCWRYVTNDVSAAVTARGFILAQFNRVELAPDICSIDRTGGIYPLYPDYHFGALSAWAWGYHRCIDALLTLPFVDAGRLTIAGHSRGGKSCLLAGATDDRIALTAPNNSGAGGAGCFRIQGEGSERLDDLLRVFPYWYGPDLKTYIGHENELPFDQHFLKAMVAPRALLSTEALGDLWANPYGTWCTHQAARKVYKWLGVADQIGIAFRPGGHSHALEDWQSLLNFIEWRFYGKPASGIFNHNPFAEHNHNGL